MLATFTMPHAVPFVFVAVFLLCAAIDAYDRRYDARTQHNV
jgi:hypothetical protein